MCFSKWNNLVEVAKNNPKKWKWKIIVKNREVKKEINFFLGVKKYGLLWEKKDRESVLECMGPKSKAQWTNGLIFQSPNKYLWAIRIQLYKTYFKKIYFYNFYFFVLISSSPELEEKIKSYAIGAKSVQNVVVVAEKASTGSELENSLTVEIFLCGLGAWTVLSGLIEHLHWWALARAGGSPNPSLMFQRANAARTAGGLHKLRLAQRQEQPGLLHGFAQW